MAWHIAEVKMGVDVYNMHEEDDNTIMMLSISIGVSWSHHLEVADTYPASGNTNQTIGQMLPGVFEIALLQVCNKKKMMPWI